MLSKMLSSGVGRRSLVSTLRAVPAFTQQRRKLHGLKIGVLKERVEDAEERRVSLHPANAVKLIKKGASVLVEKGAGELSG